jgi:hypothetical protein
MAADSANQGRSAGEHQDIPRRKRATIASMGQTGFAGLDQGTPEDAGDIRLRHRRGVWTRAGVIGIAGFFAFAFVGPVIVTGASPAAYVIGISTVLLMFIGVAGLVIAMIDTQRLRLRRQLRSLDSRPPGTYKVRIKPQYVYRFVSAWLTALCFVGAAMYLLPLQVNAASYFADPGRRATFVPTAYRQQCDKGSCHTVTAGYLKPGGTEIVWPARVPLDHPFTVPAPVWTLWVGNQLVSNRARAVVQLTGATVTDGLAILLVINIGWIWSRGFGLRTRRSS